VGRHRVALDKTQGTNFPGLVGSAVTLPVMMKSPFVKYARNNLHGVVRLQTLPQTSQSRNARLHIVNREWNRLWMKILHIQFIQESGHY
jgi:hypothetical protein